MNTLEMFVMQGEIAHSKSAWLYEHIVRGRREPWHGPKYFAEACAALNSMRSFLDNERALFVETLTNTRVNGISVARINIYADVVIELLADIVMLHVDEPDGSFARALEDLLHSFNNLVGLMRESLDLADLRTQPTDIRHLQVIMRTAA